MMSQTKDKYFEQVYKQSYRKMFNFAKRLCNNADQAEDVTQEAFVRAYAAFDTCHADGKIENWLMRIVHNVFVDSKRKEKRRIMAYSESFFADEGGLEQFADPQKSIEDILAGGTTDPILEEAIASLEPQARELLRLAYVERLPHAEIGKMLGVRTGAARSRVHRLCVQLKRAINLKQFKGNQTLA
jgi:RNA polymerase sigma-70 factor (ECF subfamily)